MISHNDAPDPQDLPNATRRHRLAASCKQAELSQPLPSKTAAAPPSARVACGQTAQIAALPYATFSQQPGTLNHAAITAHACNDEKNRQPVSGHLAAQLPNMPLADACAGSAGQVPRIRPPNAEAVPSDAQHAGLKRARAMERPSAGNPSSSSDQARGPAHGTLGDSAKRARLDCRPNAALDAEAARANVSPLHRTTAVIRTIREAPPSKALVPARQPAVDNPSVSNGAGTRKQALNARNKAVQGKVPARPAFSLAAGKPLQGPKTGPTVRPQPLRRSARATPHASLPVEKPSSTQRLDTEALQSSLQSQIDRKPAGESRQSRASACAKPMGTGTKQAAGSTQPSSNTAAAYGHVRAKVDTGHVKGRGTEPPGPQPDQPVEAKASVAGVPSAKAILDGNKVKL